MVHFDGEHLAGAGIGCGVCRQKHNLLTWLHDTLFHTASKHITNTLNLVNARNGHAHWRADRPLRHPAELVKHVINRVDMDGFLPVLDILALPPSHVVGLFQQVVTHPTRDGHHRCVFLDKVFLPPDLHEHALHLVRNLVVSRLLVCRCVAVHFVHADADLFHAKQVDEPGMLPRLALDFPGLVVALGNCSREVSVCGNHDECDISLGCTSDHVLDEIAVAGCVNDGVMPLLGVELLRGARDGHTTLALLLLAVHVEGKRK
mmetsp:Transcript_109503/g.339918  ORF Transcript_109503/g.339918 Transcript_109503/m.339918 type:complete len:261 (+) Transcript_109503:586-1368(+)